jgi:autoinducer 2-degrading protein
VTLVEIYADDASAAKHKETKHYETWRDEVADMMAAPRSAETYLAIEPNDDAWTYANAVTWNEDDDQSEMVNASCVHVHCECAAGDEAAFASACAKNASESALEDGNLRFDVFQSAESARKFLLVEVYDGAASAVAHKSTPHYEAWREEVANMMARPRQARAYDVVFPPTKISWRDDACDDACDTTW